jgi:magnesium transporter
MPFEERLTAFSALSRGDAEDFFLSLKPYYQAELILAVGESEQRLWVRLLPPDDLTDVLQEIPDSLRQLVINLLDSPTRKEVLALLAYQEDEAGGLMNPRFARLRPEMTVDEAIRYLRKQTTKVETLRYLYVLNPAQKILGVVSLQRLFSSAGDIEVRTLMRESVVTVTDTMSQSEIKELFSKTALMAIPVVAESGAMMGIITVDDIVDVVEEEATEDIQKLGGTEVLNEPYLEIGILPLIKKRVSWLVVLFVGEMFTATAMGFFEREIEKAVVLALFIPLIISSGGNSGSQASTLVVRALALQEMRLRDWWRVFARELLIGSALGAILGTIGLLRIMLWPTRASLYGEHYSLIALTVACALIGTVLWGSLCGSMLPFILKKLRFDPAVASAPFVATLVDVSGLVIYFSLASTILRGTLL